MQAIYTEVHKNEDNKNKKQEKNFVSRVYGAYLQAKVEKRKWWKSHNNFNFIAIGDDFEWVCMHRSAGKRNSKAFYF